MSPQLKTALISIFSAVIGALGGWSAAPEPLAVVCPVCVVCPAVVEAAPAVEVPVAVPVETPVVAPVVP